ncbi:DUF742 domain-containing protein [Micromonospora soli]|uniref:DUF742 domain-containing protein n=1 Tax=Micromonospora sp. NBRC 110009 TaxID=3061627 RepID=UPI002671FEE1|nr:DUF742 domain-containing protein [Micromonospora sp. NBRC 110009]WKT98070.1 DUF742 domain-containing protein [Micromonospora sp. NBRC 110009]
MPMRYWKVRPYVLTAGRTRTRQPLLVHTLVSVPYYDAVFASGLLPEARSLYEQARRTARSVAELSAVCGMSLGVTRVVVDDLAATDRLLVHTDHDNVDFRLLERLRDGLRKLA